MSKNSRPCQQHGYTLLELLVAVAIISILLGLLMPAVQKVRSAADRIRCANNLKQIGLACHYFHDANGGLPPGFSLDRRNAYPYLSWLARLLPYLDQDNMWRVVEEDFQVDKNPFSRTHVHRLRDRPVSVFSCPVDFRVKTAWTVYSPRTGEASRVALTSYLGNSGTETRRRDGVIFLNSKVSLDISDGASNTLLAGERPPSFNIQFGWWYVGAGQDNAGSLDVVLGSTEKSYLQDVAYAPCGKGLSSFRPGSISDECSTFHFWSLHPGGANFAFCDGSVRFVSYSASSVLAALSTRSGGEVASPPD